MLLGTKNTKPVLIYIVLAIVILSLALRLGASNTQAGRFGLMEQFSDS
jgi:hypothetical protein